MKNQIYSLNNKKKFNNLKYEIFHRQHMHRNMNFENKFERPTIGRKEK